MGSEHRTRTEYLNAESKESDTSNHFTYEPLGREVAKHINIRRRMGFRR